MKLYHGGKAGLAVGDVILPSPPHVEDGCPICAARAAGRTFTVAEGRAWAMQLGGEGGRRLLAALKGANPWDVIDPPTKRRAVYATPVLDYARWHAARSGHGDVYRVELHGAERSREDSIESWLGERATVLEVVERGVALRRRERRALERTWSRADRRAHRVCR